MSSVSHGAGKYYPCLWCTISFENLVHGRTGPSRLLAATAETRGKVQCLKELAGVVSERGQKARA